MRRKSLPGIVRHLPLLQGLGGSNASFRNYLFRGMNGSHYSALCACVREAIDSRYPSKLRGMLQGGLKKYDSRLRAMADPKTDLKTVRGHCKKAGSAVADILATICPFLEDIAKKEKARLRRSQKTRMDGKRKGMTAKAERAVSMTA